MVMNSLRDSLRSIGRYPLLLLSGLWSGCVVAAVEYCMFNGLDFYAEILGFFGIIAFPFFVGASFEMIRREDGSISAYVVGGISQYFSILLPGAFLVFAGSAAALILTVLMGVFGGGNDEILMVVGIFWIFIPLTFFFFFYDTAAVFEEEGLCITITECGIRPCEAI